jgi:hypothetical protein
MRDHFDSVKFANDVNYSMWSQFREALAYKPTNIKGGEPNGTF